MAYLTYMAERLEQMKRLLKSTGSIYYHCDPTASHYIKIIMNAIFGSKCFRNEIIWCYSRPSAPNQRQLSRVHDTILWFSKSKEWIFNHLTRSDSLMPNLVVCFIKRFAFHEMPKSKLRQRSCTGFSFISAMPLRMRDFSSAADATRM